jgi:small subunit ribosomal protein S16
MPANPASKPLHELAVQAVNFQKSRLAKPRAHYIVCVLINKFMSVKIRMKRVGTKNTPVFRIVVADSRSPRDGKCIEEIGTYQPLKQGENFTLKLDRARHWISKGAQPSDTVASFIKKAVKAVPAAA